MNPSILTTFELALGLAGLGLIHLGRTTHELRSQDGWGHAVFALSLLAFALTTLQIQYIAPVEGVQQRTLAIPLIFLGLPFGHLLMRVFIYLYPERAHTRRALDYKGGLLTGLILFSLAHLLSFYLAELALSLLCIFLTLVVAFKVEIKEREKLTVFMSGTCLLYLGALFLSHHWSDAGNTQLSAIFLFCLGTLLSLRWATYLLKFMGQEEVTIETN